MSELSIVQIPDNATNRNFEDLSWSDDWKALFVHSSVASIVLAIYGVKVCPLLEGISYINLTILFSTTLLIAGYFRLLARTWMNQTCSLDQLITLYFVIDVTWFCAVGAGAASYNAVVYSAPLDSSLKVLFGFGSLGFFISSHLALIREQRLRSSLTSENLDICLDEGYLKFHQKFVTFSIISVATICIVILLLIFKDLHWLGTTEAEIALVQRAIFIEVVFVTLIFSTYVALIILAFAKSMSTALAAQNRVLQSVHEGELDISVPVVSNDEFGHMAQLTNEMITAADIRRKELFRAHDATIISLTSLAGARDNETGMHIKRTQHYLRILAKGLGESPKYSEVLTDEYINILFKTAPLHDIGKVGIPDSILKKPGKLSDEEFEIMKTHTTLGADALSKATKQVGKSNFVDVAEEIARTHHERWDGSGYPNKLQCDGIPISGRLMAIADVYDALRSVRIYKQSYSHEESLRIICKGGGSQFDPIIVEVLLKKEAEFIDVSEKNSDDNLIMSAVPLLVHSR